MYRVRHVGSKYTKEFRAFIEVAATKVPVSPFHDIPLMVDESACLVNMVVEIPRWTNAKLEICKEEPFNPIKQDIKKGALRFVKNVFPHHGYMWNYGALPQTWECPQHVDKHTGFKGDNDPIDAVEIGGTVWPVGSVRVVKVLGAIALLDEGETDWKVIVIDSQDPLCAKLNCIKDVNEHCPGLLDETVSWFRNYKIPDGKPANEFAFGGQVKDQSFAMQVIKENNEMWHGLISGALAGGDNEVMNSTLKGSKGFIDPKEANSKVQPENVMPDTPLDSSVDSWSFVAKTN